MTAHLPWRSRKVARPMIAVGATTITMVQCLIATIRVDGIGEPYLAARVSLKWLYWRTA
jgi:hypothetical protein